MDKIINEEVKNDILNAKEGLSTDVDNWLNSLSSGYDGFRQLIDKYGYEDVLCQMAAEHWTDRAFIASKALEAKDFFRHIKRPADKKLTIAFYYRKIANGGAERVTAQLSTILSNIKGADGNVKYRFVLITDEPKLENEYPLNGPIIREFLPDWHECLKEDYRSRYQAWERIISKWDIDIVTSGQWFDPYSLWDMLAVKGQPSKPAFVLHIHNFTMRPYLWDSDYAHAITYFYRLCDASITLSECDREFAELFCSNVHYIPNPVDYLTDNSPSSNKEEHAIVWTGRIDEPKRPMDMVRMMEYVAKEIPDAKLYLVGNGREDLTTALKNETSKLGLEKDIVFTGYTSDVASYYKRASVYVCTSQYEGFPMSIGEALSCSLPVVMYDLPWLTYVKDGRGIKTVPMGRYDLLAKAVIQLLENPDDLKKMGQEGRTHIEEMASFDIAGAWQKVFEGIDPDKTPVRANTDERILFEHLSAYQDRVKKELRELKKELSPSSYKLPDFLTSRIDIKNSGNPENDIELLEMSDPDAAVESPKWIQENGNGLVVKSKKGKLALKLKCLGSGTLYFALRSENITDSSGNKIPIWINYTKFSSGGKDILNSLTPTWHDKPFKYSLDVKDGQIIEMQAEWTPDCAGIGRGVKGYNDAQKKALKLAEDELQKQRKAAKAELKKERELSEALNDQLNGINAAKEELERQLADIRSGLSFKLGRLITYIPRKILGRN